MNGNLIKKVFATTLLSLVVIVGLSACKEDGVKEIAVKQTAPAEVTTTTQRPLTDDERYIGLLDEYGVYYADQKSAVGYAKFLCRYQAQNGKDKTLVAMVLANNVNEEEDYDNSYHYYSTEELSAIYRSSTAVYCPQYS